MPSTSTRGGKLRAARSPIPPGRSTRKFSPASPIRNPFPQQGSTPCPHKTLSTSPQTRTVKRSRTPRRRRDRRRGVLDRFTVRVCGEVESVLCGHGVDPCCGNGFRIGDAGENFLVERPGGIGLLAARSFPPLVDVLGIARGAAGLFDEPLVNHRDDRVVGHPAFARAVVVQNVTETQPALLHYLRPLELA